MNPIQRIEESVTRIMNLAQSRIAEAEAQIRRAEVLQARVDDLERIILQQATTIAEWEERYRCLENDFKGTLEAQKRIDEENWD